MLIADPSEYMRGLFKIILKNDDFYIIAETGKSSDVVTLFLEKSPDLVLIDLTVSKIEGLNVIKEITNIDTESKIVVLSTTLDRTIVHKAIKCGARNYILKPYVHELLPMVKNLFN